MQHPFFTTHLLAGVIAILSLSSCSDKPVKLPPKAAAPAPISSYNKWNFGDSAYSHTANILAFGSRKIESPGHKKTQAYISAQLRKHGWLVTQQSFTTNTPYGPRNFTNLIARLSVKSADGKSTSHSPAILLGAHYDSKMLDGFLGADDAASCVGALLEIAENLPKQDRKLASSIELIFFDGEEALKKSITPGVDGLYGSSHYATYLTRDLASSKKRYQKRPSFGIVLDMIGHKNLSIKIPSDTPYNLLKSYYNVVERHELDRQFGSARGPVLDDHVPLNEIAKVPTLDLIGDFNRARWWHTKADNLGIISKKSLSISIQFTLELIQEQLKVK